MLIALFEAPYSRLPLAISDGRPSPSSMARKGGGARAYRWEACAARAVFWATGLIAITTSMGLLGQRHSGRSPIAARTTAAVAFRSRTTKFQDSFGEEACL